MPLVTTKEMLHKAQAGGYAVGAFNVENLEMMQAVVWAAQACRAPVILQTTPSTLRYADPSVFAGAIAALAAQAGVPVALHLDHGESLALVEQALGAGYTSVMIDGSHHSLEDNIALTQSAVRAAGEIPVEAELGKVGGKEDDLEGGQGGYTDPGEAALFVAHSGASSLAMGIGTAHGLYVGTPKLDLDRLADIRAVVPIPLVLHGASGLSDEDVRGCIARGVCKVNFATELRIAYTRGVRGVLDADSALFDPKAYGKAGRAGVQALVEDRMAVCGCVGKA